MHIFTWKYSRNIRKKFLGSGEWGTLYCVSFGNIDIFYHIYILILKIKIRWSALYGIVKDQMR